MLSVFLDKELFFWQIYITESNKFNGEIRSLKDKTDAFYTFLAVTTVSVLLSKRRSCYVYFNWKQFKQLVKTST